MSANTLMTNRTTVFHLQNGIRCAYEQRDGLRALGMVAMVPVGSAHEPVEHAGISHLIEHLCFDGIPGMDKIQLTERLALLGANCNGATSQAFTQYSLWAPEDSIEESVRLLTEMIFIPTFREHSVANELRVISNEIRQHDSSPKSVIQSSMTQAAFHGQPHARHVVGTEDTLANITASDIRRWHAKFYVPHNFTIGICGGLPHSEVVRIFEQTFGQVADDGRAGDLLLAPVFVGKDVSRDIGLPATYTTLLYPGYPESHADRMAASMASISLGGGMTSRLFRKLREEEGICYSVESVHLTSTDFGLMTMTAVTSPENVEQAVTLMQAEAYRLAHESIADAELQRMRNQFKAAILEVTEQTSFNASLQAQYLLVRGAPFDVSEFLERVNQVTAADIRRISAEMFGSSGCRVTVS